MSTATQPNPKVGKTYLINHSRKGRFTGRVTVVGGDWASVQIVNGQANAILPENRATKGEDVTVRLSLATFTEVKSK